MLQYFIFHKPYNVLSQFSREGDKQTLADYLKGISKDIYPVGRLDYDSEGLLLLTNDKKLNHQLLDPAHAHKRTYWVQIDGMITDDAIQKLEAGVDIQVNGKMHHTKNATVKKIDPAPNVGERNPPVRFRKNIPTSWIALTITEGKNRQVRKMTATVGYPTLRLIRYSIGNINIEDVPAGTYREIDAQTVKQLFSGTRP